MPCSASRLSEAGEAFFVGRASGRSGDVAEPPRAARDEEVGELSCAAPSLSQETEDTHSFLTGVLNVITGILNRASSSAARGDRIARALTMASTR